MKSESRLSSLLALLLVVPVPSIGVAMGMIIAPDTALGQGAFALAKVWLLALPLFWLVVVDKRKLSWSRPRRGGFGVAALLGLLISVVIFAAHYVLGDRLIDPAIIQQMATKVGFDTLGVYVGAVAYWVLVNSLLEEYVWRWFVFRKCEVLMPPVFAILASALFFTLHHFVAMQIYFSVPMTVLGTTGVFIGGALWSWCYLKYRSVWPGFLSHAIVDVAIFLIGYRLIFT